ncbi:MAG: aspartate dehydrogenase [Eubacteriales bacterium]|nr:aspartate dehydrogenase [Eubacteriales bacterium]
MFFRKKRAEKKSYDREHTVPVLKCSICNGEKVAGFRDLRTGKTEEICLIRTEEDLKEFLGTYGLQLEEIRKEY